VQSAGGLVQSAGKLGVRAQVTCEPSRVYLARKYSTSNLFAIMVCLVQSAVVCKL